MGKSISASTKTPDTWSINGDEVLQAAYSLGVSIDVARAPFRQKLSPLCLDLLLLI